MFNIKENEENILKFWEDNKIFKKSVDRESINGDYSFYDGPPFATGLPHYGHVVASVIKDLVPRFKTMQGYRVERRWGWDCHGLPVENLIEKELGFKTKKDIEDFGVENFNNTCKNSVLRYADEWKKFIPRIGRWVDMDNDYKTMTPDFMESIWWVFKELYDKGLVYEDYKSMHVCSRCETSLSNFEVTLGYKDITDLSATCKFKLKNEENTYVLAWTTTPWTLPGNVALAVGKDISYAKIQILNPKSQSIKNDELYILAKDVLENILKDEEYSIIQEIKGKDLIGLEYEPLFEYFVNDENIKNKENGWKIYHGDFVATSEGTGIVHIAPAFGEDDMNLAKENKLPFIQHVKMDGHIVSQVKDFAGLEVKPKEDTQKTDLEIVKFLLEKNKLFAKQKYSHSYPHCWRCDTPLLNYATSSWFVRVTDIKDNLLKNNNKVHWVPDHIKTGRFGKWLENVRDWAVSRSRFWGTPLPVWRCENDECKKVEVIGSVEDLFQKIKNTENKDRLTKLIIVRHGESEKNIKHISWSEDDLYPLTEKGRKDIQKMSEEIDKDIDVILCSPVLRARESAEIFNKKLNKEIVIVEELRETKKGIWEGENISDAAKTDLKKYKTLKGDERYLYKRGGGESFEDVKKRIEKFINILKEYKGKKVLVITHNGIMVSLEALLKEWDKEKFFNILDKNLFNKTEIYLDHTTEKEFDLHKQVVDKIDFSCSCGSKMKRITEVFDCWFESGSMPYSSFHYPIENKNIFNTRFPAQFIAEGQDQTRGWFYTLMVLATALFNKPAFENVVVNGIVLAGDGQKMSKKLKNYPDPYLILDKYGADALRYYLMASPVVNCEDLNFSEKGVDDIVKKIILKIVNVLEFYKMANVDNLVEDYDGKVNREHGLDIWIYARINKLIKEITEKYNGYYLADGTRLIEDFVDDLSNWYLRRSRMRLKSEDKNERFSSLSILREILLNLSMVIAPSMPFIAEYVYQNLKIENKKDDKDNYKNESIHLCNWPDVFEFVNEKEGKIMIDEMNFVKTVVNLGLSIRKQKDIAVKQPLSSINIVAHLKEQKMIEKNREIILEELNVKSIGFLDNLENIAKMIVKPNARLIGPKFGKDVQNIIDNAKNGNFEIVDNNIIVDKKWTITKEECEISYTSINSEEEIKEEGGVVVSLDLQITEELKNEGYIREFVSLINKLRSEKKLSLKDRVSILYYTDDANLKNTIETNINKIKILVLAENIEEGKNDGMSVEIGEASISIDIIK